MVDARGIYSFPGHAALRPYDTEEARAAQNQLQQNLDLVRVVSKAAADMIENCIQLIILRKDVADPTRFSSSSWPGCAGLMGLSNIQGPNRDNGWGVDALVHELVHSLLYMIECFEPFYLNRRASLAHTAISPWSGKELKLHSFVHACFVWFALLCFWNLAARSNCFPEATTEFFRRRARHRFDADLLACIGPAQFEVVPSVRSAIETVQQIAHRSQ